MWVEENSSNSAETVTINPWAAGLSQPQAWQGGMGRGSNQQQQTSVPGGASAYRGGSQQRSWHDSQQQQQLQSSGGAPGWTPTAQMAWNPMPPSQPANAWHLPQQQQWTPTTNSPSGTYADQAKKNVPLSRAGPPTGGPPPLASGLVSGPPRLGFSDAQPQHMGGNNWGGTVKVDQQTPWDTTGNPPPPQQPHEWNTGGVGAGGGSRWGQPTAAIPLAAAGANSWQQPTGHVNAPGNNGPPVTTGEWSAQSAGVNVHRLPPQQQPGQHHDTTGTAHWNSGAPPPVPPTSLMMVATGGAPPPMGGPAPGSSVNWCQPVGGPATGGPPPNPGDAAGGRLPYDPNPQTPGPWVAPQPAEMNNDMMWHDPNPKQKKVQRDTGTSVWGDPSGQRGEIRRWKEAEQQEQFSSAHTAVHSNPNNADWATLPLMVPAPAFQPQAQPTEGSGWGDAGQDSNSGQESASVDIGTSQWGASNTTNNGSGTSSATWLPNSSVSSPQDGASNMDINSEMPSYQRQQQVQNSQHGHDRPTQNALSDTGTHLSLHIEQIQTALKRGVLSMETLKSPLMASNHQIMTDLTNLLQRFFAREHELSKLQQQQTHQPNAVFKNEEERLICEINSAKTELAELQRSICSGSSSSGVNIPGQNNASAQNGSLSSSNDGQSRLQQWKKTSTEMEKNGKPSESIGSGLQSLITASQNLSIQSNEMNGGSDWKSGALDWSPPSTMGMSSLDGSSGFMGDRHQKGTSLLSSASSVQMTNTMTTSGNMGSGYGSDPNSHHQYESGEYGSDGTPPTNHGASNSLDDGPPEFVPGKKWEWRDPNKVAEDPNATPGTCKPNPLLSSAALQHGGQYSTGPTGGSSGQQHGSHQGQPSDSKAFNAWTGGNATPFPNSNNTINPASEIWNSKVRGTAGGSTVPPPMGGPPPPTGLLNNPPNRLMGPPPSILGYPGNPGLPPSSGSLGNRGQFGPAPVNFASAGYWILFQLVNINDQQIQAMCSRVGRLVNFMIVGHKIACAKFSGANIESILQRFRVEYMFDPNHIKVVPDDEFDKMMRASRAQNMPITNVWNAPPPPTQPGLPGGPGDLHWSGSQEMMMGPPPIQHFGGANDEMGRPY